jgi:hypothetical protein
VHHHGLWFSWKYINRINFWEHAQGRERPAGRTSWTQVRSELRADHSARIELELEYSSPDGERLLAEARTIEVSSPAADGSYAIDWTGRFTALADEVLLDRTPLPGEPGGQVFGGYAGFSVRLTQLDERGAVTLDGPVEFNDQQRFRGRSLAFDYHGTLEGRPVGVAVLDHPDNPRSPSPWYAIRSGSMSFFTPAVLCYEPLRLARGDELTLRYRVIVHPGRWDAERLGSELDER